MVSVIKKEIDYGTNFGNVNSNLKQLMDDKHISISTMSKLTNIKYDIVKKYYYEDNYAYTKDILAKFCYVLECNIDDILVYEKKKDCVKQD